MQTIERITASDDRPATPAKVPTGPSSSQEEGQPSRKVVKPPKPRKVEKRQRGRKG